MYYRRYFEGAVSGNTTKDVTFGGYTTVTTAVVEKSFVIGKAIEETLKDAGMDAYYDTDKFILYFNRKEAGLGLYYNTNNYTSFLFFCEESKDQTNGYIPNNSTSFSGSNYKFYITLLGEPTSLCSVAIGSWNSPTSMTYGFTLGHGENKKTKEKLLLFYGQTFYGVSNLVSFSPKKINGYQDTYTRNATYLSFQTAQLTGFTNGVVLKEVFDTTGMYTINNCYMGCKTIPASATGGFYSINGEEYYSPNQYFIIKCPSKIVKRS